MLIRDVQVNVTETDIQTQSEEKHVHVSLLLLPSVAIAIFMLTFLSISFIRHHRQYRSKRKSQIEHMKASGKRQRIGAPTCFGNSFRVSGGMPPYLLSEYKQYSSNVSSVNEVQENEDNALPKVSSSEQKQTGCSSFSQKVPSSESTSSESDKNSNGMTGSSKHIQVLKNLNSPSEDVYACKFSIKDLSGIAYADDSSPSPESMTRKTHCSVLDASTYQETAKSADEHAKTPSADNMNESKCCNQSDSMKGSIINETSTQPNVLGEFEVYQTPGPQCSKNETETEPLVMCDNDLLSIENKMCMCEPSYSKFNRHNRRFSYLETFLQGKRMDLFRHKKVSDTGENIPLRENEQNIDSFLQCRRKLSNPSITAKCLVCNKIIA